MRGRIKLRYKIFSLLSLICIIFGILLSQAALVCFAFFFPAMMMIMKMIVKMYEDRSDKENAERAKKIADSAFMLAFVYTTVLSVGSVIDYFSDISEKNEYILALVIASPIFVVTIWFVDTMRKIIKEKYFNKK